ncbi:MAG: single-stranded DNA-binding protein [Spirochaetales bacterium]|nr:single-stranded DNA-binding protein [Spirochaetales bacterium]
MKISDEILRIAETLSREVQELSFGPKVHTVYNPLTYAWNGHAEYLRRYGGCKKKVLFLGINPGPWGMVQTGVPFGEINAVRDWMGIEVPIGRPEVEHPKRPVEGFSCTKSEVSGRRFWGLMKERFKNPRDFFTDHFVANYCPLVFMEESSKNLTPDKLTAEEQKALFDACDRHLAAAVEILKPRWLIGIGKFAMERFSRILPLLDADTQRQVTLGSVLHPSPASPAANKGWAEAAERQLKTQGVW